MKMKKHTKTLSYCTGPSQSFFTTRTIIKVGSRIQKQQIQTNCLFKRIAWNYPREDISRKKEGKFYIKCEILPLVILRSGHFPLSGQLSLLHQVRVISYNSPGMRSFLKSTRTKESSASIQRLLFHSYPPYIPLPDISNLVNISCAESLVWIKSTDLYGWNLISSHFLSSTAEWKRYNTKY